MWLDGTHKESRVLLFIWSIYGDINILGLLQGIIYISSMTDWIAQFAETLLHHQPKCGSKTINFCMKCSLIKFHNLFVILSVDALIIDDSPQWNQFIPTKWCTLEYVGMDHRDVLIMGQFPYYIAPSISSLSTWRTGLDNELWGRDKITDSTFNCVSLNEICCMLIQIYVKVVPFGPNKNDPPLI